MFLESIFPLKDSLWLIRDIQDGGRRFNLFKLVRVGHYSVLHVQVLRSL